jgi:BatD DUF11 like domain
MSRYRKIFLVLLLALPVMANGQEGTTLKASVDRNRILLGEPFTLTMEAGFAPGSAISFVSIDSIPHFEWLEKPVTDTSNENGRMIIKRLYRLTSFDSGHWVIPAISLSRTVRSDTLGIDVLFAEFDPAREYHDIKDIIEVNPEKKKEWWWYAAGGAVLLVLLLVYLLRRKKPAPAAKPAASTDPYEEAMIELEQLQNSKPESKQYYTRLTAIFRMYVFRRKGILSLQKTTDDLVVQLKDLGMPKDEFEKIAQALRLGDLVKFAKYAPNAEEDRAVYDEIFNSIKRIEKSEAKILPEARN